MGPKCVTTSSERFNNFSIMNNQKWIPLIGKEGEVDEYMYKLEVEF